MEKVKEKPFLFIEKRARISLGFLFQVNSSALAFLQVRISKRKTNYIENDEKNTLDGPKIQTWL